ncbi:MAG: phosphatase PAP2 family protein [Solirubrobacteraceae bacterium]
MARATGLEAALARLLRAGGPSPRIARFSSLGEHGAVWLIIGGVMGALGRPQQRDAWRRATARVAAAYAVNTALKLIVRRRRPPGGLSSTLTGLSFPSAHAATSFAAARGFTRAGGPAAPLYALAGALALSRLRLGVHHPSDVLAGAVLGFVVAGGRR